jgi:hypothetical protein
MRYHTSKVLTSAELPQLTARTQCQMRKTSIVLCEPVLVVAGRRVLPGASNNFHSTSVTFEESDRILTRIT